MAANMTLSVLLLAAALVLVLVLASLSAPPDEPRAPEDEPRPAGPPQLEPEVAAALDAGLMTAK